MLPSSSRSSHLLPLLRPRPLLAPRVPPAHSLKPTLESMDGEVSDSLWVPACPRAHESKAQVSWLCGWHRRHLPAQRPWEVPPADWGHGAGSLHLSRLGRVLVCLFPGWSGHSLPRSVFSRCLRPGGAGRCWQPPGTDPTRLRSAEGMPRGVRLGREPLSPGCQPGHAPGGPLPSGSGGSAGRPLPSARSLLPAAGPSVPQPQDAFLPLRPGDTRGRSPPSSRGPAVPSPGRGVPSGSPRSPGATWERSRQRGSSSR